jgi:hypothetical protein
LKSCQANQRTIEGAVQTYAASNNGVSDIQVAALVTPNAAGESYIKTTPICSKTTLGYHLTLATVDGDSGPDTIGWSTANGTPVHKHF